jgi:signal transduction histidine kinase
VSAGPLIERLRRIVATPDGPIAVAAALAVLSMIEVLPPGDAPNDTLSSRLLLGLCATAPLGLARSRLVAVAITVTLVNVLTLTSELFPTIAALIAQLIIGYLLGRNQPRRISFPFVLPFVAYAIAAPGFSGVLLLASMTAVVMLGSLRRGREQAIERIGSSQAIADSLLEHAARGERARIARELHDVVAHHISLIAVQAETARLTTPGMPADGAKRLIAIGDTARSALTEMRRLLGVLREDAGTEPTRAPQPGLVQLNELIDDARDLSGASTRLIVRGQVGPLDPGIELTAYRIVQEALTNARRHAPGAAVDVELCYTADALLLRVRDNGPGPAEGRSGHGLIGMRERAAMAGGAVSVGPATLGGFLVEVALPTTKDIQ